MFQLHIINMRKQFVSKITSPNNGVRRDWYIDINLIHSSHPHNPASYFLSGKRSISGTFSVL